MNATDTSLDLINLTILQPAAEAIEKQFANQPAVAATLRHVLAERYHDLGMDAEALELEEQALAARKLVLGEEHPDTLLSLSNAGVYLSGLGRKDEAETYHREALDKSRRVRGDDDPETLVCVANVGSVLQDKAQFTEAEPYFREALEAGGARWGRSTRTRSGPSPTGPCFCGRRASSTRPKPTAATRSPDAGGCWERSTLPRCARPTTSGRC